MLSGRPSSKPARAATPDNLLGNDSGPRSGVRHVLASRHLAAGLQTRRVTLEACAPCTRPLECATFSEIR
jgi:hypothetical protein